MGQCLQHYAIANADDFAIAADTVELGAIDCTGLVKGFWTVY